MEKEVSLIDEVLPTYYTSDELHRKIKNAYYDELTKRLMVSWNDEGECTTADFPSIWLRDNCTCAECFSASSQHRSTRINHLIKQGLAIVRVENKVDSVECEWASGHVGVFYSLWLWHRRFTEDMREARWNSLKPQQHVSWCGSDFKAQKGSYKEVTETDQGFIHFAESMMRDGCFILTGAPLEHCAGDWANKTKVFTTPTFYGEIFEVDYRGDPTNLAYSTNPLDFHIDQTYLNFELKIQYLHFEKQAHSGGENILTNGIFAARKLREEYPSHYEALTQTLLDNTDTLYVNRHFEFPNLLYSRKPLIITNRETGEIDYIQYSSFARSSFMTEPIEKVEKWYEAMEVWSDFIDKYKITFKCEPGDILVFDNIRVMHGRLGFDSREPRMLEGWYSEWDWIHSGWRVAKHRQLQELHQSDKK